MKRKLAIILAAVMAMVCLAGCSGATLEDKDFQLYDYDGNILELNEDPNGWKTLSIGEGDEGVTSRGIKVGSTLEEVKKAYGDVWGSVEAKSYDDDNFSTTYSFRKDKMKLSILVVNETEIVGRISIWVDP